MGYLQFSNILFPTFYQLFFFLFSFILIRKYDQRAVNFSRNFGTPFAA